MSRAHVSNGARHWRSDSVFYGSLQWQIESMRRLEILDDIFAKVTGNQPTLLHHLPRPYRSERSGLAANSGFHSRGVS